MKLSDTSYADLAAAARKGDRRRLHVLGGGTALAAIAIAAGITAVSFRPDQSPLSPSSLEQVPALTITAANPRLVTWPVTVSASGSVAPWQEASIGARVGGLALSDIRVNVGDKVRRGQVLARFDADLLRADESQLAAGVVQAEATAAQADANRARALALKESGGISEQDILQNVTLGTTARAAVVSAQAQLASKQLQLRYAEVLAPDDGTISARSAALGAVTPAGQELFRLIRQDRLEWRGELTAPQLSQIAAGQRVSLTLPDGDRAFATVRQTAPSLDGQTRLGTVFADLDRGSGARSGMYANGEIATSERKALAVPAASVVIRDGHSYVLRLQPDGHMAKVSLQPVTVGRRLGAETEIVQGLVSADRVAVVGAGFLNEGDLVRVQSPEATSALPATTSVAPPKAKP
jgi:RND family efflux transporter MFP subunit